MGANDNASSSSWLAANNNASSSNYWLCFQEIVHF